MRVHYYDWRWRDETLAEVQAVSGNRFARKPIAIGSQLSLCPVEPTRCAGHRIDGTWHPCASTTPEFKSKCQLCRAREGAFVFTAFDGFDMSNVTAEDIARLQHPHVVYVAYFAPGLMKVGVSGAERSALRQIEQGSHATLYIAACPDGIIARQIETTIRRAGGLNDKIMNSQKRKCLQITVSDDEVEREMRAVHATAAKALEAVPELYAHLHEPRYKTWSDLHQLPAASFQVMKLAMGESASGTVVGVKGAFVLLDCAGQLVALCGKDYNGMVVDFTPTPPGLQVAAPVQNALF